MKITKLILENFEAIQCCLGTSYLELDLDYCENNICLLIGPNGSGKTTILSLLTPFSTIGNLDVRDGYHLVTPHKEGKKEIWYQKGRDTYKIQHYYTPSKETHTTKSFIQLNDQELNINGNVTSFKEIVKTHLGIELSYMKLVRLGPNVKSLIDSTSTDRKNFMGKLLDDIGVYLEYYKHVNNNLRTLKEMISHAVDQSKRMMYEDRKEYEKQIKEYTKVIENIETKLHIYQDELAVCRSKMEELGDISEIRDSLEKFGKTFKKLQKVRDRLGKDIKDAAYYKKLLETTCESLANREKSYSTTEALLERELTSRNDWEDRVHKLNVRLDKESTVDQELKRLYELLNETIEKVKSHQKILKDFKSDITVHDFENFLVYLKSSQQTISTLYEFGNAPMKEVVDLIRRKQNVEHYISSGLLEGNNQDDDEAFLRTLKSIITNGDPICDKNRCAGHRIVTHINNLLEERAQKAKKKDGDYYQMMHHIYIGLSPILEGFHPYAQIISKFPEKIQEDFKMLTMLSHLEKGEPIYDAKRMDNFYTLLKEQEALKERMDIQTDICKQINTYETFSETQGLREDLAEATTNLEDCKNKIMDYREDMATLRAEMQELKYTKESLTETVESCEDYESVKESLTQYQAKYDQYHECMKRSNELQINVRGLMSDKTRAETERNKLQSGLTLYLENKENLENYQMHFDNMSWVRQSLSSNKGIPTIIVKHYLKDTVKMTNDLLDVAYHGNIVLADFEISPDEFMMPVYNRGKLLPDVKLLSQGEVSLTSVALSFALVSQSLNGYNIMSLDEIDGALDSDNRRNFLLIMERQIERIGSEQNFMITHNDAFSSQPVDIIDLSGHEDKEMYPYATFIPIHKSKEETK